MITLRKTKTENTHDFKPTHIRKQSPLAFTLKLVSVLALGVLMMVAILPHLQPQPTQAFVTTLRVEINPAFELSVDHKDKVVDIIALNPEAEAFDKTAFLGQPVSTVVDALLAFAIQAGFIDETAVSSDVVTITLVVDEDERPEVKDAVDNLGRRLRAHLATHDGSKVDVIFIKATLRELFAAREKDIPLGLFVINGHRLLDDGTLIPMREFMKLERGEDYQRLTRAQRLELRALERTLDRLSDEVETLEDLEEELIENGSTDTARLEELRTSIASLHERIATIQERVDELDDIKDGYSEAKRARERLERQHEREAEQREREIRKTERLREREERRTERELKREERRSEREERRSERNRDDD